MKPVRQMYEIKRRTPKVKNKGCVVRYGKPAIHGAREMERRKKQIECGQLKAENGLAL